jgi:uncharacterized protein (TIGR02147 family)
MEGKTSIFQYTDYRQFLRDYYARMKKEKPGFSFRYFSKRAGFKSGNILKIVMDGKRNIALHSIGKFTEALKLNKREADYFKNLVLFNQSSSVEERQKYAAEFLRSQKFKEIHPLTEAQFKYFSRWYFTAIRELVYLPAFKEDPKWISKCLIKPITAEECREAIDVLLRLGLVVRNKEGRLVQSHGHLATDDEVASAAIAQYHRDMMRRASESIETVKREKREISSITMIMGEETMKKIKEKIQNFRRDIIETVAAEPKPHAVYQLNFQFFPVAEVLGEEK